MKASKGWSKLDWIAFAFIVDVVLVIAYCDWAYSIAEWWGYAAR